MEADHMDSILRHMHFLGSFRRQCCKSLEFSKAISHLWSNLQDLCSKSGGFYILRLRQLVLVDICFALPRDLCVSWNSLHEGIDRSGIPAVVAVRRQQDFVPLSPTAGLHPAPLTRPPSLWRHGCADRLTANLWELICESPYYSSNPCPAIQNLA